jgi:hypothetical protein
MKKTYQNTKDKGKKFNTIKKQTKIIKRQTKKGKLRNLKSLIRKCQIQLLPRFFFGAVVGVFLQRPNKSMSVV